MPKAAIDEVWKILQEKPVDAGMVNQLREDCGREDVFPDRWDQGKDINILAATIKDEVLGSLHQGGLAQEYQVKGEYKSRI